MRIDAGVPVHGLGVVKVENGLHGITQNAGWQHFGQRAYKTVLQIRTILVLVHIDARVGGFDGTANKVLIQQV